MNRKVIIGLVVLTLTITALAILLAFPKGPRTDADIVAEKTALSQDFAAIETSIVEFQRLNDSGTR